MTTDHHLVLVARADRQAAEDLAGRLRAAVSVRTAYDVEGVLDRLESEVDLAIVDPTMGTEAVETVRKTIDRQSLDCLVARLIELPADEYDGDTVVTTAVSDKTLREDVLRLANQARYRKTLDAYYDTACRAASSEASDEYEQIQARLDKLADRLDDTADQLDSPTLFRAALDPDRERDDVFGDTG